MPDVKKKNTSDVTVDARREGKDEERGHEQRTTIVLRVHTKTSQH